MDGREKGIGPASLGPQFKLWLSCDGAEGAFVDRSSGDFLFATWGGDNVLIAIHGFNPPPPPVG